MIIAVDGPTASGKGTIARALARQFALPHLDTGLLYRAVGWQTTLNGGDPDNPEDALAACAFRESLLENAELRSEAVGGYASRASIHPQVRAALLDRQKTFAARPGGAVLDGRDIGTVIVPNAPVKLYVTASTAARAGRRFREMRDAGKDVSLPDILAQLERRDARDTSRDNAPLAIAKDAFILDTTELGKDDAIAQAIAVVVQRTGVSPPL